jgi:predicted SprT family Zn-dependent metalloprotease
MSQAISRGEIATALPSSILAPLKRWFSLWGLTGFEQYTTVCFSGRLRRVFGRCYARRRQITVAARLKEMQPSLLEEVLCHEVAHLAVFELFGENCRPHGPEWAQLMRTAGYEPRIRLVLDAAGIPAPDTRPRYTYLHYCPVCQSERVARRPVRSWRCADCVTLGLHGRLEIRRRPGGGEEKTS